MKNIGISDVKYVWELIDNNLIQCIDALDNGQMPRSNYKLVTIANIISDFNVNWDENTDSDDKFLEALKFAKIIFDNTIKNTISKYKAKESVENAIKNSDSQIMVLNTFLPWKEFLLKSNLENASNINFVIFPSNRGGYTISTVPKDFQTLETRKQFPKEWAGLRKESLQKITNVNTATFCHKERFIASADEKEDAIKLAKIANEYVE